MPRLFRLICALFLFAGSAAQAEIYVDNASGRDANDGSIPVTRQGGSGPVRTLARAAQLAKPCDTIILANTGSPYYDSLSLTGYRHSGLPDAPFVINGNGATISGLRSVPPEGWRNVQPGLWKLTLSRKGYYQLLRNGRPLTELIPESGTDPLKVLPAGQWVSWQGHIFYRQDSLTTPDGQAFAVTSDQTGISLHKVSHVLIMDVHLQHFRFDGLHAQGICHNVQLRHVDSIENGRAGIACSGASQIDLFGGTVERNGRDQILVFDRSVVVQHESDTPE